MVKTLAIVCGVLAIGLGVSGWFLWGQIERNGKLQLSVDSLTKANEAKTNATKSRATVERTNRTLGPDAIIDKLR